jgi:hypothetical protein
VALSDAALVLLDLQVDLVTAATANKNALISLEASVAMDFEFDNEFLGQVEAFFTLTSNTQQQRVDHMRNNAYDPTDAIWTEARWKLHLGDTIVMVAKLVASDAFSASTSGPKFVAHEFKVMGQQVDDPYDLV